jgi:hypothetical protein
MAVMRLGGFQGEFPRIHPRFLPDGAAQQAVNAEFKRTSLESIKDTSFVAGTTEPAPISLFRYSDTVWLEAETDTDWVTYPVIGDSFGRVIFADPSAGELRVTDASLVGTGGYPATYRRLDIPPPTSGFSATLQGDPDDADEVPETRFYVCTFVNEYGAEGPPSPASNEVEWRSGQTVLLEAFPSVPTGNYNITHRRIYRVNTGSSANTEYQYVTEVAVASNPKTVTNITQANPAVVTTSASHSLSTGQEVVFSGLGLDATAKTILAVTKANPARVTVSGHGYQTGDVIAFDNLGAGNGMDELDGVRATITVINTDNFDLNGIDSTAYTAYVANGTATLAYGMDELNGNQYQVDVIDATSFALTGIDSTGYFAYNESGTVSQVAGTSYTDAIPSAGLGEVLPTEIYDPPNSATIGIKEHPSGFLAGFYGKTVAFSEIGAPHAWPIEYRLTTAYDIVGLGVYGNTVVITTKGWPYMAVGSDPSAMTMVELEIDQACTSKRGIVDFGAAIAYPSPDGLLIVSPNGIENVTRGIFTQEQWKELVPSSFEAYNWEGKYLCFYDDGTNQRGMILEPFNPEAGVRYVEKFANAGFRDLEDDQLYVVVANQIESWNTGTNLTYTWKSSPTYAPNAVNFSAAKVHADAFPVTVKFHVDDVIRHTRMVYSEKAFRLPGNFKGEKFEVTVQGTKRVTQVSMGTSMRDLAATV